MRARARQGRWQVANESDYSWFLHEFGYDWGVLDGMEHTCRERLPVSKPIARDMFSTLDPIFLPAYLF